MNYPCIHGAKFNCPTCENDVFPTPRIKTVITTNQPNELDKAIAMFDRRIEQGDKPSVRVLILLSAAKRLKEVEKERGEAIKYNITVIGECDQLHTEYKKALEALDNAKDIIRKDNIFLKDWLRGRVHPGVSRLIDDGNQVQLEIETLKKGSNE